MPAIIQTTPKQTNDNHVVLLPDNAHCPFYSFFSCLSVSCLSLASFSSLFCAWQESCQACQQKGQQLLSHIGDSHDVFNKQQCGRQVKRQHEASQRGAGTAVRVAGG